jgi:hypothetical protein
VDQGAGEEVAQVVQRDRLRQPSSSTSSSQLYGHLWPGEEDRVRDAIGRLFRADELRGAKA